MRLQHLSNLASLISDDDVVDELYQRVDVPLKVAEDTNTKEKCKFLLSEHNRDGDSYRSPWSDTYFPPFKDGNGVHPSERLRILELHANEVFNVYRELYYGRTTSVSSVYLWDTSEGFAGCFLVQNALEGGNYWNSINVIDVGKVNNHACIYKLTSTILLSISPSNEEEEDKLLQQSNISGSLTRHNVRECKVEDPNGMYSSSHIINIGKFIEDVESEMRSEMDSLYVRKTKNVVEMMRKAAPVATQGAEHTRVLNEAVLAMAMNRKANI